MPGRKPKPTELKILQGTLNVTREKGKVFPTPPRSANVPPAPDHLVDEAKTEWDRLAVAMHIGGMLADTDLGTLANYCQAWGDWLEANRKTHGAKRNVIRHVSKRRSVDAAGTVTIVTDVTYEVSPYWRVKLNLYDVLRKLASELGLTPSSRTRVNKLPAGEGDKAPEGKWSRFA